MEKNREYEEEEIIESEEKIETSDLDSEVPKNFKPEADTIKAMQEETVDASADKDVKSEELKLKAEKAVEDSIKDKMESGLVLDHGSAFKGVASEAAACETIGNNARNLNEYKGNNKRYDITSDSEIASVKTKANLEGELDVEAIGRYKSAYKSICKENTSEDGARIIEARDAGYPVPDEIKKAKTAEEAADYLNEKTVLRISDDHVNQMREIISEDMVKFPENYMMKEGLTKEGADMIVNERIKGLGLEQKEIIDISSKAMKNIKRRGRGR